MFASDAPPVVCQEVRANDQSDVIEIVGNRDDQALKIDRRTYRVQQTPHSAQKDSIQLLRGLPAVTITPDDQIMLLGSGNVTIEIDGRTVSDPDTIAYLRTLHGGDLERIEVITNPSAQYSSAGTGGIINFVLRRKQRQGNSGSATAEVSSLEHGYFDGQFQSKRGKWTYELHAGGRAGTTRRSSYHKLRSVEQVPGGAATINTEDGGGPTHGNEVEGSAKLSYDVDPRTSVSANVLGATARDVSTSRTTFAGLTPDFQSFTEQQRSGTAASFLIGELGFGHKGRKDGESVNASLRTFATPRQHETNSAAMSDGGMLSTDKLKHFVSAEGQLDWQHPMAHGRIVSLGGLWNYSRMSEHYGFASSSRALGPAQVDRFAAIEDTLAGYATVQQPVGTWTVMPGVRVERNSRHVTSPGEADVAIARTEVFPTVHVAHPLSRTVDLTLSYTKRIDRPQLNDLRPYPLVQDLFTIKQANPRLKDQSVGAYEINLKYHRKKLDAGVIVYDRETSHLFSQSYTSVNSVSLVTIINSGHSRDRGAEFDFSTPVLRRVKLMASANLFDSRIPVGGASGTRPEDMFRYTTNGTLEWDGPERERKPGDVAQLQWIYNSRWRQFEVHDLPWNQFSLSYTHSVASSFSLSGTLTYNAPNRHRLKSPLVQEYFRGRGPVELSLKLLKTFGRRRDIAHSS